MSTAKSTGAARRSSQVRLVSDAARLALQACPCCGTSELLAADERVDGWIGWSISCAACALLGPLGATEAEAARRWNRLPPFVSQASRRARQAA